MLALLALSAATSSSDPVDFPLGTSRDHRTLVTRSGKPFPILGRTAWFVLSLSKADQDYFLDDTVRRGFTAVEFHFTNHDKRGNQAPFDGNRNLPFVSRLDGKPWDGALSYTAATSEAPDYTTPNAPYWDAAEAFVERCARRGLAAFAFPAYVGYAGGEQGWMKEVVANGPGRMHTFGQTLGRRFARHGNIVWMAGGDFGKFDSAQRAALAALYDGLAEVREAKSRHWSAEWDSGMIGTDQADFAGLMTLNGVYTWVGSPSGLGLRAYGHTPPLPAFLLEEPYDQEGPDGNNVNPNATQPVRRFQWWGWLTTIGGYVAGNGFVWPFRAPEWKAHLDTPGSRDLAVLNRFVRSIPWWRLRPAPQVVSGNPSAADSEEYVAAAISENGDSLVAYFPPKHGLVTIDFRQVPRVRRLRWMDPTTGAFHEVPCPQQISPPPRNAGGERDWVLVGDAGKQLAPSERNQPCRVRSAPSAFCSEPASVDLRNPREQAR